MKLPDNKIKIRGPTGAALIRQYRQTHGDTTILAFSCGKDSISTALAVRDSLSIVPVHYYIVPDLPMVEESLDYYERHLFKRRIIRFPDQRFYDWLDTGTHLDMRRMQIVDACNPLLPNPLTRGGGVTVWLQCITSSLATKLAAIPCGTRDAFLLPWLGSGKVLASDFAFLAFVTVNFFYHSIIPFLLNNPLDTPMPQPNEDIHRSAVGAPVHETNMRQT